MALTKNGKLIGKAASEDLRDQREHIHAVWVKEQRQLLIDRENALVDMAIDLPGFDEFWESVPDFGTYAERIQSLEEFIASHTPIVAPKPKTVTTS